MIGQKKAGFYYDSHATIGLISVNYNNYIDEYNLIYFSLGSRLASHYCKTMNRIPDKFMLHRRIYTWRKKIS